MEDKAHPAQEQAFPAGSTAHFAPLSRRAFVKGAAVTIAAAALVGGSNALFPQVGPQPAVGEPLYPQGVFGKSNSALGASSPVVMASLAKPRACPIDCEDRAQRYGTPQGMAMANDNLVAVSVPHPSSKNAVLSMALFRIFDYQGELQKSIFLPTYFNGEQYVADYSYTANAADINHCNSIAYHAQTNMLYIAHQGRLLELDMERVMSNDVPDGALLGYETSFGDVPGILDKRATNSQEPCCLGVLSMELVANPDEFEDTLAGITPQLGSLTCLPPDSQDECAFVSVRRKTKDSQKVVNRAGLSYYAVFGVETWHLRRTTTKEGAETRECVRDEIWELQIGCGNKRMAQKLAVQGVAACADSLYVVLWYDCGSKSYPNAHSGSYAVRVSLRPAERSVTVSYDALDRMTISSTNDVKELEALAFVDSASADAGLRVWVNNWNGEDFLGKEA